MARNLMVLLFSLLMLSGCDFRDRADLVATIEMQQKKIDEDYARHRAQLDSMASQVALSRLCVMMKVVCPDAVVRPGLEYERAGVGVDGFVYVFLAALAMSAVGCICGFFYGGAKTSFCWLSVRLDMPGADRIEEAKRMVYGAESELKRIRAEADLEATRLYDIKDQIGDMESEVGELKDKIAVGSAELEGLKKQIEAHVAAIGVIKSIRGRG